MTTPPTTVALARRAARQQLAAAGVAEASLEADLLLTHVLGLSRTVLLARTDQPLEPARADAFHALVARRIAGEPVAYLVGEREFFGLRLRVTPAVLVPRPETELVVEAVISRCRVQGRPRPLLVDVGTGSGAIAIALATSLPAARVLASDVSLAALAVAKRNLRDHGLAGHVRLIAGHLVDWLRGPVDAIAANLPYLRPDQAHAGIGHEPALALYAGVDGFELYRQFLATVPALIRPGGLLGLEIDPTQANLARSMLATVAPGWPVEVLPDLAGHERVVVARRPA